MIWDYFGSIHGCFGLEWPVILGYSAFQVAQNDRPLYPILVHNPLKVANNYGPQAFEDCILGLFSDVLGKHFAYCWGLGRIQPWRELVILGYLVFEVWTVGMEEWSSNI